MKSAPWIGVALSIIAAAALTILAVMLPSSVNDIPEIHVAFVGNSITFVNDLPRFMEALSGDTIVQNSCLHGALSFSTILEKGNGMYNKWRRKAALMDEKYKGYKVYDHGACTFLQLLFGYDDNLSEGNENGLYTNDGKNPCFRDPVYLQYLNQKYETNGPPHYDFVVMNDQTRYPAEYSKRLTSLQALTSFYASIFLKSGARPVFLATHGYKADRINTTKVGDVPEFTSRVHYGYQQYAQALGQSLPTDQAPLIAPVGLAFLVLWEETHGLWERLFFTDGFHPSPHGTYLMGCVVYATLYNRMPPTGTSLPREMSHLWRRARKMQIGSGTAMDFPTVDEAAYLFRVAQRVVLEGYIPHSLLNTTEVEALEVDEINSYNSGYSG
jgi:hypothetical protein